MQYCLLELPHEQQIVDNSVERRSHCSGMWAGRMILRDLCLDERGTVRMVFAFRTSFHIFGTLGRNRWAQQEGDSLGCACTTDLTISTCRLTSTSSITRESVRHMPCHTLLQTESAASCPSNSQSLR
jgi:hypothetical protein